MDNDFDAFTCLFSVLKIHLASESSTEAAFTLREYGNAKLGLNKALQSKRNIYRPSFNFYVCIRWKIKGTMKLVHSYYAQLKSALPTQFSQT